MTKRKKFRPARFLPGRGVPWHGGMKPLPRPTKHKKTAPSAASTEDGDKTPNSNQYKVHPYCKGWGKEMQV